MYPRRNLTLVTPNCSQNSSCRLRWHPKGQNLPPILTFTSGPDDWRELLADRDKHWRTGYSAKTLAHCWESAWKSGDGFPSEVAAALKKNSDNSIAGITALLAVPEFKVPLPGGVRPSQNDLFVLARSATGPVTIMVEGKVNESFGPTLGEWREEASDGKELRLGFLLRTLGLAKDPANHIRYQLLHRAASAIITGEQFRAVAAVLLVHSFSTEHTGWPDYEAFAELFGVKATRGVVQKFGGEAAIPLFGVWVEGDGAFLES